MVLTKSYLFLSYTTKSKRFLFKDSKWILGGKGERCDKVCAKRNLVCNPDEQSKLTSKDLVRNAMKKAGEHCKRVAGPRDYAGTPFFSDETCVYLTKGSKSVCTDFTHKHHSALCYCGKIVSYIDVLEMLFRIFMVF